MGAVRGSSDRPPWKTLCSGPGTSRVKVRRHASRTVAADAFLDLGETDHDFAVHWRRR
jgi:hypothetical protein